MISSRIPAGRSPDVPRRRRTRRARAAATSAGPPTKSRVVPSGAPDVTIEPAPAHCAAFWRQGPG